MPGRDRHAARLGQHQGDLAGQAALPAAYALESLLQQLVFLTGPLLVTAITAVAGPSAALTCSAALVTTGLVASLQDE